MNDEIPFAVKTPNTETIEAIAESKEIEHLPAFKDLDELFEELETE